MNSDTPRTDAHSGIDVFATTQSKPSGSAVKLTESAVLAGINDDRKSLGWKLYRSYSAIEWTPSECVIRDAVVAALKTPRIKRLVEIAGMDYEKLIEIVNTTWVTQPQDHPKGNSQARAVLATLGLSTAQGRKK